MQQPPPYHPGYPPPQPQWPAPQRQPPPSGGGSVAVKVALGAVVMACVVGLVWAAQKEKEAFAPLAAVCGGGGGWAEARELRPGVPHRYAGARMGRSGWEPDRHRVGADVTAAEPTNADAVVCFGDPAPQTLESCTFSSRHRGQDYVRQYPRTQDRVPLRVLAARTGAVLAEGVVEGAAPPACPESGSAHANSVYITGASVDGAAVSLWLSQHVAP